MYQLTYWEQLAGSTAWEERARSLSADDARKLKEAYERDWQLVKNFLGAGSSHLYGLTLTRPGKIVILPRHRHGDG